MSTIVETISEAVPGELNEHSGLKRVAKTPVMATPGAFAGAAAYTWVTLQAYNMGREHAGANG